MHHVICRKESCINIAPCECAIGCTDDFDSHANFRCPEHSEECSQTTMTFEDATTHWAQGIQYKVTYVSGGRLISLTGLPEEYTAPEPRSYLLMPVELIKAMDALPPGMVKHPNLLDTHVPSGMMGGTGDFPAKEAITNEEAHDVPKDYFVDWSDLPLGDGTI